MQLSHYLKVFPYEERPGHLLLFSTKKASLLLLKEETFSRIEQGGLSKEGEALLAEHAIVVADREEEKRDMYYRVDRLNAQGQMMNVCVFLNMDCNFSCIYCYEGGLKGKHYMSGETAGLLVDFIKKNFTPAMKRINLDFYGGEPLLSLGLIKDISRELKNFVEDRGAAYSFSLVTNGSLFNRQVALELKALGLKGLKVTLDGPAEVHDKCRPFKSGAGSFETIIRNIKETCDVVGIGVGGNFDRKNYGSFPSLLDYLVKEGLTPGKVRQVKFDPVAKRFPEDTAPADYADGCMSVSEPWLLEAGLMLREDILKRGYFTPKPTPLPCQVEIGNYYSIDYDGTLYKCPAFIGRKDFAIGSLMGGVADPHNAYKAGIWKNSECLECVYLPLCFGGCRYFAYLSTGNVSNRDCKRPYFDAVLETVLRQDIRYRHT
ncbi:MAG TPA: geopeptide radical SAM maturase [Dissulfurispiraceae bacterium]